MPPGGFANPSAGTLPNRRAPFAFPYICLKQSPACCGYSGRLSNSWGANPPRRNWLWKPGSCLKQNTRQSSAPGRREHRLTPNCNVIGPGQPPRCNASCNQHRSRYHWNARWVMKNPASWATSLKMTMPWNQWMPRHAKCCGSRSNPRWVHFPNGSDRYWNCALG